MKVQWSLKKGWGGFGGSVIVRRLILKGVFIFCEKNWNYRVSRGVILLKIVKHVL